MLCQDRFGLLGRRVVDIRDAVQEIDITSRSGSLRTVNDYSHPARVLQVLKSIPQQGEPKGLGAKSKANPSSILVAVRDKTNDTQARFELGG
jgi:hypothetical protein